MSKERFERVKKAYITTDEVLNGPAGHQYGIDEKRAIKDFIFAINYLEQQNKRYKELMRKSLPFILADIDPSNEIQDVLEGDLE